jgi:ABC-type multidrug transport system fused ATPase/permease subunit
MKTQGSEKTRWYYLSWIIAQYRGQGRMVAFMLLLTGLSTAGAVLIPLLFRHMLDSLMAGVQAVQAGELAQAGVLAARNRGLLLLLLLGFGPIVGALYPWIRSTMNLYFEQKFREKYFREVLAREPQFFLRFPTGDVVTRLSENVKTNPPGLPWLCCSGIFRAVTSVGIIVCCLIGMIALHPKLALAALAPLPFMLWLFVRLETTIESCCEVVQEKVSETTAFLESAFSGIRILKSFTAESPRKAAFLGLLENRRGLEMTQARTEGLFQVYFEFLTYLGEILVLIYGGYLTVKGELSLGSFYAFLSYLGMILPVVMDVPMLMVTLTQAYVIIDRLEELEAVDRPDVPVENLSGAFAELSLQDVRFGYSRSEPESVNKPGSRAGFRLERISLAVNRGEKVAIMGAIGSGKTTLLSLAAGILPPDSGAVMVNGRNLDEISPVSRREWLGFVQQEPVVFSETVGENIRFWRDLSPECVENSADLARMREEIGRLPKGYDERLGIRGAGLSGGQRQRLSLARALAGNPQLLLMDDVTAALDAENERQLWRRLKKASPETTCLIVTHRAATARVADRVIVLDNGRIVAQGRHGELVRTCPLYRELISASAPVGLAA